MWSLEGLELFVFFRLIHLERGKLLSVSDKYLYRDIISQNS